LVSFRAIAYQEGEVARLGASGARTEFAPAISGFARLRTATQGSFGLLPLFVVLKKNMYAVCGVLGK
jgi:hypothetical protein